MSALNPKNAVKNIFAVIEKDMQVVDEIIYQQMTADTQLIHEVAKYLISSGGKRIRPALVVLLAKALNYEGSDHLKLAATIEFIHTATLLHDDVVDQGEMRRGKISANCVYGNDAAVLVGDFLYTRAFQMMVDVAQMDILQVLSDATNKIAQGEVMQLENIRNKEVSEANYFKVIEAKTAKLFEASATIGALIAKASPDNVQRAKTIGHNLGMAFQIVDDCLDYLGSSEEIGKSVHKDIEEGKITLPLIYFLQKQDIHLKERVMNAIENNDIAFLDEIIDTVRTSGALDYCQTHVNRYIQLAKNAINGLPDNVYKQALLDLAEFSSTRAF